MSQSKKILITGAAGDTGGAAIDALLSGGASVRALVRRIDERSDALAARGAEVVAGDLSRLDDVRRALDGIGSAYFCYTIREPGSSRRPPTSRRPRSSAASARS